MAEFRLGEAMSNLGDPNADHLNCAESVQEHYKQEYPPFFEHNDLKNAWAVHD